MSNWVNIDGENSGGYKFSHIFENEKSFYLFFTLYRRVRVVEYNSSSGVNFFYMRSLILKDKYSHKNENLFLDLPNRFIRSFYYLFNNITYRDIKITDFKNNIKYQKYLHKYPFLVNSFADEVRDRKIKELLGNDKY